MNVESLRLWQLGECAAYPSERQEPAVLELFCTAIVFSLSNYSLER